MSRNQLSKEQRDRLAALAAMPDRQIDTSDIPEAPAENWAFAQRGQFYRPRKEAITIRLDADVLAWFRNHAGGKGYQTEINRALREYVLTHQRKQQPMPG